MYYVGIDWADQKHDITVVDEHGAIALKNFTIKKSPAGFAQLLEKLRGLSATPQDFKVGIETPHNLLVDYLLDFEYAVFTRFPGTMKSLRKRYRPSGARDDEFDAFVLADALRTDKTCWRAVDLGSELVREIRLCVRHHHQLLEEHVAAGNGLRATLKEYYPAFVEFFADVTCANARAFLCAYPEFELAARLTHEELAAFFKAHNLRNGKIVKAIDARLRQPHLAVAAPLLRVKQIKALACAKRLDALAPALAQYEQRLAELVTQHPDGKIFLSYPGAATVTAARLLALFGDNRARYVDAREVQALAGTCPVTEKSGKNYHVVYFRRACNKFYRDTVHHLAFSSLNEACWARAYYDRHRRAGHKHSHALRCLAHVHLRVLFAMWQTRTCYDENLFLAQRARNDIAQQKIRKP